MKITKILSFLALSFSILACESEKTEYNPGPTHSSKDIFSLEECVAASEMAVSDVINLIQLVLEGNDSLFFDNSSSNIIITPLSNNPNQEYPLQIDIDLGTDTVLCFDNRYRAGKITATASSFWKDSLSVIDIEMNDYYFATYSINSTDSNSSYTTTDCSNSGSISVIYKGITNNYNLQDYYPTQEISVDSIAVSVPLGQTMITSNRKTYYYEGMDTDDHFDDKTYNKIHSSGFAIDHQDNEFEWQSSNLTTGYDGLEYFAYNRDCFWFVSGDILLHYEKNNSLESPPITINFGKVDQTYCDNAATVIIHNNIKQISLP